MLNTTQQKLELNVSLASGQGVQYLDFNPGDTTVRELVEDLSPQMDLPKSDAEGRPQVYQAMRERGQLHLHGDARLADVLESGDSVVILPDVQAG